MRIPIALLFLSLLLAMPFRGETPPKIAAFAETHCLDCHSGEDSEVGFDLGSLAFKLFYRDYQSGVHTTYVYV